MARLVNAEEFKQEMKEGQKQDRMVGCLPKPVLQEKIKQYLE